MRERANFGMIGRPALYWVLNVWVVHMRGLTEKKLSGDSITISNEIRNLYKTKINKFIF